MSETREQILDRLWCEILTELKKHPGLPILVVRNVKNPETKRDDCDIRLGGKLLAPVDDDSGQDHWTVGELKVRINREQERGVLSKPKEDNTGDIKSLSYSIAQ